MGGEPRSNWKKEEGKRERRKLKEKIQTKEKMENEEIFPLL